METTANKSSSSPQIVPSHLQDPFSEEEEEQVEIIQLAAGTKRQASPLLGVNKKKSKTSGKTKALKGTPLTLEWLGENYLEAKEQCLPRSTLYMHYQDFCKKNDIEPVSQASFGKFIRQKFPNLSTRRLGTRGQSKYHYYGIAIKESSPYYNAVYTRRGITRFSIQGTILNLKKEATQFYSPNSKCGTLLPEFPSIKSAMKYSDKLETFTMMYKTHCQRIVDTICRTNFEDVQEFLVHFWQGMPAHLLSVLSCQATIDFVTVCDFEVYQTLLDVLVPSTLQPMSDGLMAEILQFGDHLIEWLSQALSTLPSQLGIRKWQTADIFNKQLKRQVNLVKLSQPARNVLRSSEMITALLDDWRGIKFPTIAQQSASVLHEETVMDSIEDLVGSFASELESLLLKQPTLDVLFEWLDSIIEKEVAKINRDNRSDLLKLSQQFLLVWNYFGSSVERDLTLDQAKSYGSFRDLIGALDEYVAMVLEYLQFQTVENQYKAMLSGARESSVVPSGVELSPPFPPPSSEPTRPHMVSVITKTTNLPPPSANHSSAFHQHGISMTNTYPSSSSVPKNENSYQPSCSLQSYERASYNSFPLTPSPSHASSSLSSSPEPTPFDTLGFSSEGAYESCNSDIVALFGGTSSTYDFNMTTPRYDCVDNMTSVAGSSRCSFYSDTQPLVSPSFVSRIDQLTPSPLETVANNDISHLFDFSSYGSSNPYHNNDLEWFSAITPESEPFDSYGFFSPPSTNIPIPLV
jgi:regulatory factor X 4